MGVHRISKKMANPIGKNSCCWHTMFPNLGITDWQLSRMAKSGKLLDVKISTLPLWVRYSRKRPQQALVNYPVLRMTDWVECIFRHGGHFFLAGRSLDYAREFGVELHKFWENYKVVDPDFLFWGIPGKRMEAVDTDCHPW